MSNTKKNQKQGLGLIYNHFKGLLAMLIYTWTLLISTEVTLAGGCMQLAIGWKYPVKKAESRIEAENIVASSLKHPLWTEFPNLVQKLWALVSF